MLRLYLASGFQRKVAKWRGKIQNATIQKIHPLNCDLKVVIENASKPLRLCVKDIVNIYGFNLSWKHAEA
jgi:hypothetical protein